MGFIDLFKRGKKPTGQADPADALAFFPPWATPPRRGTTQLLRTYREAPWLRAVVHKVGVNVGQVNWRLYARGSAKSFGVGMNIDKRLRDAKVKALVRSGRLTEVEDHPLLALLDRPNQQMTGAAMLQLLQAHYDLKGEAFNVIHRSPSSGDVDGLFPVPPSWVTSIPNSAERKYRVVPSTGRGISDYDEDQILFLRDMDPEQPYSRGTGIAEALGDELETDEYASRFVKSFFYNGGMPGMLVGIDGAKQEEIKKAKEQWLSEHQGVSNASKPMFTTGKVTVTRLDTSFKDQGVVQMRIMLRDFVRQVYGVPPEVLGITENSNRATANTAYFLFAQNVVLPRLEIWRAHFQAYLVSLFGDELMLDFDSPVPSDRDQQLQVMRSFPFAFSLGEMRELAGAEPLPGFDRVFPPMAMPGQDSTSAPEIAAGDGKPKPPSDETDPAEAA
jgi:HK97 family phage portal protein